MSKRVIGIFATVLLLSAAPAARAVDREAQERSARKACLSGDYAKGVELLSDLFIDTKDPTHIFNQARCFEQNSRYEEAISRFREYLRKAAELGPAERAETEKHIADCQALLGPKATPAEPQTAAPSFPVAAPPAPDQTAAATSSTASPGRNLRIAGVACGAVGLASIGTAIYFYTRARSFSDKVSAQTTPNPSDEDSGKSAQTMQWVFYSVGAAAIATGTVLYALGWPSADAGHTVTGLTPLWSPGLAGIAAQGAF